MSAGDAENIGLETVSSFFDKGLKLYDELCDTLDPSDTSDYQAKVKKSISVLEETTRLVSTLGIFSSNENVEEVATSELKFFLLPVLLGDLNLKLKSEDRLNILNLAEIYFKDFLQRCKEYTIVDIQIPNLNENLVSEREVMHPGPMGFEEMARCREEKIKKFREAKELEKKIIQLKVALDNPSSDESTTREYYLLLIKKFAIATIEELKSISQEKPIVEHLATMKKSGTSEQKKFYPSAPLKPMIITRDAVQKAVYGIGYPSIPGMTVEELVNQRMKDGFYDTAKQASGHARSLMDETSNMDLTSDQDAEAAVKEYKLEVDDAESLARARQFDEWKDDHRRGYGNRHNMG